MKKIKLVILMVIVLIPTITMADMAAPMSNYKVRVSNSNGANLYKFDSNKQGYVKTDYIIEYDKIIKITYEMIIDDQVFGGLVCIERDNCGYINLSNTSALDINLDDYYHEASKSYYVFDETCYLYDGPSSKAYNKIKPETALPVGYTFSSNYYDDLWTYIPEKKAWVYTYTYSKYSKNMEAAGVLNAAYTYKNNIITMEEVKVYDNPKTKANVLITIPANTKLTTTNSYNMEPHYPFYYITYNGVTGFIETIHDNENYVITNIAYEVNTLLKVSNNDGVKLYKEADLNSEVIATIPYDTEITASYALFGSHITWMYKVEYNNQIGWVEYKEENFSVDTENKKQVPEEISEDLIEKEEEESVFVDSSDKDDEKVSIKETIIICIIVVVILSLTAFVTVLLINKKKEQKNANKDIDNNS